MNTSKYSATYSFKEFIKYLLSLKKYRFVYSNRVISTLHKRYQDSLFGVLWAALTPLMMMTVLAFIFPLIMRFRLEGYLTYIFSGLLSWGLFSASITGANQILINNKGMMKKIYLPKIIFPASLITVEIINFFIVAIILHLVLFLTAQSIQTNWIYLIIAMILQGIFCLGIACLVSISAVYFRDLKHILGIAMQAMFYLTPIIYPVKVIPEKYMYLMYFNPFYYFVRLFHDAIYFASPLEFSKLILPSVIAFTSCFLGLFCQYYFDRKIIYRL